MNTIYFFCRCHWHTTNNVEWMFWRLYIEYILVIWCCREWIQVHTSSYKFIEKIGFVIVTFTVGVTFQNKFEKGDWSFVLWVGATIWLNGLIHPYLIFVLLLFIPFKVSSNDKTCKNLEQLSLWSLEYMACFQRILFWLLLMVWGLMTHKCSIFS